jgi:hypothetical protein
MSTPNLPQYIQYFISKLSFTICVLHTFRTCHFFILLMMLFVVTRGALMVVYQTVTFLAAF